MSQERKEQSEPQAGSRRRIVLGGLALFFFLCGVGYGTYWEAVGRFYESTDDAYVHGNLVPVMPQVSGTVVTVYVDDTQLVKEGQPLVELDKTDARLALEQAKSSLASTVRRVEQLYQTEAQLKAKVRMERAKLAQSSIDFNHYRHLTSQGFYPQESTDHTGTQVDIDRSSLASAEHELAATRALVAKTDLFHHPDVKLAAAKLRDAYLTLRRTTVVSPVTGFVSQSTVQIGQQINPGTPLMSVVPLDQIWVDANFKESQLSNVRIGQPVTLVSDFYGGGVPFEGTVVGLGAGTGSAFALLPPQNATGNWIKIVQRVPVRIALDPRQIHRYPLRVGLSMDATVDTHDRNGPMLATKPHRQADYVTTVFDHQDQGADQLIARIIRENAVTEPAAARSPHPPNRSEGR